MSAAAVASWANDLPGLVPTSSGSIRSKRTSSALESTQRKTRVWPIGLTTGSSNLNANALEWKDPGTALLYSEGGRITYAWPPAQNGLDLIVLNMRKICCMQRCSWFLPSKSCWARIRWSNQLVVLPLHNLGLRSLTDLFNLSKWAPLKKTNPADIIAKQKVGIKYNLNPVLFSDPFARGSVSLNECPLSEKEKFNNHCRFLIS